MDKTEFKKLLFNVAFCTMACDGHIDKREIEELRIMDKNTTFFEAIDLSDELAKLVKSLNTKGTKVIQELFESLSKSDLSPIQELIILEVALRIINADEKHDENEYRFINLLRGKLRIHDEIIRERFGKTDLLRTNEYTDRIHKEIGTKTHFDFKIPETKEIEKIELRGNK
ncbi:MAG: hypothetical protein ACOCUV_03145 [bacterium]